MGIHGEAGVQRCKLENADQIAATLVDYVAEDLLFAKETKWLYW